MILLQGLWASMLFASFTQAGGFRDARVLTFLPLVVSLANWPRHRTLKIAGSTVAAYLALSLLWGRWVTWLRLQTVAVSFWRILFSLPIHRWNHLNASIAAPLLVI